MKKVIKFISKPWLWIPLVVIVVLFLLYKSWGLISSLFSNGADYTNLDSVGSVLTEVQAKSISEGLYSAMASFGTDENAIYRLLKDLSKADFAKVYNAFGTRYYFENLGTWGDAFTGNKIDLLSWLHFELSSSEIQNIKDLNPNIF